MSAGWLLADWFAPDQVDDWLNRFAPLVASPFVGSTLGVLIRRLPRHEPVVLARSACESCGRRLRALELVPVLSFIALRGRCRRCGAAIARRHLAVELAAVVLAALAIADAGARGDTIGIWGSCVFGWTLLALAWIDIDWLTLPDVLTLPLLLAGLGWGWMEDPDTLVQRALGAALGYTLFRAISLGYRALRGREGLGEGDAKLLAACAAWLGAPLLAPLLLLAALLGVAAAAGLRLTGSRVTARTRLPFGPCLALAAWLLRLWVGWAG